MRALIVSAGCLLLSASAFAQEDYTKFEVATVKPAALRLPPGVMEGRGGPGSADPGQVMREGSLRDLVLLGLDVRNYQLSTPDWTDSEAFQIVAKVPPGATKEQLNGMVKNLLVERFHLTYHHEAKEMSVYELLVGKDGPKLKESDLNIQRAPLQPGERPTPPSADENGFPVLRPGPSQFIGRLTDGIVRWSSDQQPISGLAAHLEGDLGKPVVDKTGLTGRYDIKIAYAWERPTREAPADDTPSGGPSVMKAVEEQLGLKLQAAKDPVDVLVIDHIDKVPTEN